MQKRFALAVWIITLCSSCQPTHQIAGNRNEFLIVVALRDRDDASERVMNILFRFQPFDQWITFEESHSENLKLIKFRFGNIEASDLNKMKKELSALEEVTDVHIQKN